MNKHWKQFSDGIRYLQLSVRNKDGSEIGNKTFYKELTRNTDEFESTLARFSKAKTKLEKEGHSVRIYSSVNARCPKKGVREFKRQQLDADYFDQDSHLSFYMDCKNRLISSFMKPSSRLDYYFMIDVDEGDNEEAIKHSLNELSAEIVCEYETKSGLHIITKPFNCGKFIEPTLITKDGLMLLDFTK